VGAKKGKIDAAKKWDFNCLHEWESEAGRISRPKKKGKGGRNNSRRPEEHISKKSQGDKQ